MPMWLEIAIGLPLGLLAMLIIAWAVERMGGPSLNQIGDHFGRAIGEADRATWTRGYASGYTDGRGERRVE